MELNRGAGLAAESLDEEAKEGKVSGFRDHMSAVFQMLAAERFR